VRRRSLVIVLFCLFIVSLLFSQLTTASAGLRIDEAATRFLLEQERTGASLVIENSLGREIAARVRVELIDPEGRVRASNEREEIIKQGTAALFIPLPFQFSDFKDAKQNDFLWYRLRYLVTPKDSSSAAERVAGIISLSGITPDIFEVRVTASEYAREGASYRARLRAVHPIAGNAIEGVRVEAQVKIEANDDKASEPTVLKASGVTDADGYTTLDFDLPRGIKAEGAEIKVIARRGIVVQEADDTIPFDTLSRIFISTDKPLYQPGQTLHARALIFSSSMQAVANTEMPFKITDPEGTIVFRTQLKTSRFGAAAADWLIPENTRLGEYMIAFGRDDSSYAFYKIKISRYDLPNFMAKVKPDHPFYLPGQNAEVEVRADYLFGQPVKRGHVRVVHETEREWNYREQKWETEEEEKYEGETDAEGRFIAHVNLKKEHEDLKDSSWAHFRDITYAAYFTDTSTGRTEQRRFDLRVTKEPIHVYVTGDNYGQSSGLPLEFYVSTFYADGTPAQCEVLINKGSEDDEETAAPKRSAPGKRMASVRTNAYGLAKVSKLRPIRDESSEKVYLRFSARDARGAVGHRNEDFYYRDNPGIRVTTNKSLYSPREPLNIDIVSTEKDLNVIVDVSKDLQVIRSEMVRLRDGRGSLSLAADERFKNEVTVTAYAYISPREYINDSHAVLYPHDNDLKLDVRPGKEMYRPGEEAHVNFNVNAPGGSAAESALGVVIFDRAVEERARTDQEFGSGYNLYGNYGSLLGWDDSLAGVRKKDLERLDLSKPQPDDIYLLAEMLLNKSAYFPLGVFSGEDYELNQATVFSKLTTAQLKPTLDALNARYTSRVEHPSDEASLRRILSESGINFDTLLDPWGTPYRPRFFVENERDVLKILSAGADKRFDTADDFSVAVVSWLYFRPVGEAIDRAVKNYHARTSGYIRDTATLKAELLREGIDLGTLRDRWGQPYAFEFGALGVNYFIKVISGGPNRVLESRFNFQVDGIMNIEQDDFLLWTSWIDYLAERRAEIYTALQSYLKETRRFPQDMKALLAVLRGAKIDFNALRDPWGRAYYATFKTESSYTDRVTVETRSRSGEKPNLHTQIKPVTQKLGIIKLRSAGVDGREGTQDDFDVGVFTMILSEQSRDEAKSHPKRAPIILKGNGGAISGTVLDVNGAVIPNATVRATLLPTEQFYEATTNDQGRYLIGNLPPGTYEVSIEAANGFMGAKVIDVVVRSLNVTEINITLEAGTVTSTVEITSSSGAAINQTTSSTISESQIKELPLNGRDSLNIVNLRSGAINVRTKSGGAASTPRLREYFPETLVWQPLLETDAQGRAELRFKLADNITTWKLAVIGSTASGEMGMAEKEILAFQPFFVEHDPPRILTEGDELQLAVVLRNYLDKPQSVKLQIKPENWFALLGPSEKRAEVAAGDNTRQTFDLRAVASVKDARQRITATGVDANDQIEKPVSVHPDGQEIAKTVSGILGDDATLDADIAANAIKGTPRAELKIYPSLMAHVVESIEGIMERPYGCAEQTISAAYPSLLALRAYKRMKLEPPIAAKARRYVQAGYERLLNYRASSGGFSYWGRGEADLALTAYALRYLHESQDFIEVEEDVIKEARDWLFKQQRGDGSWVPARAWWEKTEDKRRAALLTAYIARVLAMTEDKDTPDQTNGEKGVLASAPLKRALVYLSERYKEIDEPYLIASYALASLDAGEPERAKDAITKLRALAHEEGGASYWSLETNTPFYGWGLAGRIETTALALQALSKYCGMQIGDCGFENTKKASSNPQSAIPIPQLIDRGLLFLLRQQDRYGVWYSTQATVNTLDALVTLLTNNQAASREAQADGKAEVFVNGKLATTLVMPPGNQLSSPLVADLSQFVSPGSNRIEIRRAANSARASLQVVSNYYVPWSKTQATSHADKEDSARSLRLGVSYDKIRAGVGDEITCKVEAERIGFRGYGMMLAEIGLPPGADVDRASLEHAMKESDWSLSQYDILPDRLIVYLWPQAGGTNFVFKFRPRFGLAAQTAPSLLYDYYNPEARVVIAPTKFMVK
jgi:hypothetical protein